MKNESNLSHILGKEHQKIGGMLEQLSSQQLPPSEQKNLFEQFKWAVEKHLFLEEKAIFTTIDNNTYSHFVPRLLSEHNLLLNLLQKMEQQLSQSDTINFSSFSDLLKKHESFEELTFYPHLEQELNSSQKRLLMEKISINVR